MIKDSKVKNIVFLSVILLAVAVGTYFAVFAPLEGLPEETGDLTFVTNIDSSKVKSIKMSGKNGEFTLVNDNGTIYLEGYENANIEQEKLLGYWQLVCIAQVESKIEENPADLSVYGFNDPKYNLEISMLDGNVYNLMMGSLSTLTEVFYVTCTKDNIVYTMDYRDAATLFNRQIKDFKELSLYSGLTSYNVTDMEYIIIKRPGMDDLRFEMTRAPGKTEYHTNPDFETVSPVKYPVDFTKFEEIYVEGLISLRADDVMTDISDLSAYGIDDPIAVLETKFKGVVARIEVGKPQGDESYIRDSSQNFVYKIKTEKLAFLETEYSDVYGNTIYVKAIDGVKKVMFEIDSVSHVWDFSKEDNLVISTFKGESRDNEKTLEMWKNIFSLPTSYEELIPNVGELVCKIVIENDSNGEDVIEIRQMGERKYSVGINGESFFSVLKTEFSKAITLIEG